MSNNGAPDSWESQADVISEQGAKDSDDVSTKFSTLNVNAVEFVPSFCKPSQASDNTESPTTPNKSESGSTNSAGSPVLNGCGDGGGESGDGGAASASPRVEEPPPVPPAAAAASLPVPPDVSPTADSWEAEADDALLTPEDNNDPEDEEAEQQELEVWGTRRGGAWGGAATASALLRAAAPLAASSYAPLRNTALSLLAKLLPAVPDTKPGLQAILECLDSSQPEVTQAVLDKLPDLVVGMQEHGTRLLLRVFELGMKSRYPVEQSLAKCVTTLNLHRGC